MKKFIAPGFLVTAVLTAALISGCFAQKNTPESVGEEDARQTGPEESEMDVSQALEEKSEKKCEDIKDSPSRENCLNLLKQKLLLEANLDREEESVPAPSWEPR